MLRDRIVGSKDKDSGTGTVNRNRRKTENSDNGMEATIANKTAATQTATSKQKEPTTRYYIHRTCKGGAPTGREGCKRPKRVIVPFLGTLEHDEGEM